MKNKKLIRKLLKALVFFAVVGILAFVGLNISLVGISLKSASITAGIIAFCLTAAVFFGPKNAFFAKGLNILLESFLALLSGTYPIFSDESRKRKKK